MMDGLFGLALLVVAIVMTGYYYHFYIVEPKQKKEKESEKMQEKTMSVCQCENADHHSSGDVETKGCQRPPVRTWDTSYGVFRVCIECAANHRPPARYFRTGPTAALLNAAKVIQLTPRTRAWLMENDPQALNQLDTAIRGFPE